MKSNIWKVDKRGNYKFQALKSFSHQELSNQVELTNKFIYYHYDRDSHIK